MRTAANAPADMLAYMHKGDTIRTPNKQAGKHIDTLCTCDVYIYTHGSHGFMETGCLCRHRDTLRDIVK